jgi:hypothetical protein
MARKGKGRQPNLPEEALARARAELYGEAQTETPTTQPQSTAQPRSTPRSKPAPVYRAMTIDDLRQEYAYVIRDLSSMFVLAAVLFVGLIVTSLILV